MGEENTPEVSRQNLLRIAADIVAAYVSRNETDSARVPEIIAPVFEALRGLTEIAAETRREPRKPAVPVRRSVTTAYIVCLEDGRKFKMLKRRLRTSYNITPAHYPPRWNVPAASPMVAPPSPTLPHQVWFPQPPRHSLTVCQPPHPLLSPRYSGP